MLCSKGHAVLGLKFGAFCIQKGLRIGVHWDSSVEKKQVSYDFMMDTLIQASPEAFRRILWYQ